MKNYFLFLIAFVLAACGNAQVEKAVNHLTPGSPAITNEQLGVIFDKANLFPNETQLSFAFIKNGNVQFYGIKRTNDTLSFFDNHDRVFEIGSISKVFTSTLLAHFVAINKVSLEDPINNYIPTTIKNGTQISFKQLANHTSGLPRLPTNFGLSAMLNPGNPYEGYTDEKLVEYITQDLSVAQPAGEKYGYSNLGAGMLGFVLCQLAASDYQKLMKEHIFSKYNMARSTTIREEIKNQLVIGLNEKGKEVSNWDLSALVGAGGILSTAEDLSKFALAQFDTTNQELALTRTKTFGISESMDIGLGWHLLKTKSGNSWCWHNGGTGGYTSSMAIDTERKNGIVILSNVSAFSKDMKNIDNLCFDLMRTLEK